MNTLLTVEEAAAALHATVTVAAIRAAIREGRLAATRIGIPFQDECVIVKVGAEPALQPQIQPLTTVEFGDPTWL